MSFIKRLSLILVFAALTSMVLKFFDLQKVSERNVEYASFLCAANSYNVQIGNYRDASEDIRTFFNKFKLGRSTHLIKIGDQFYHESEYQKNQVDQHICDIEGRKDIIFKLLIEKPHFFDSKLFILFITYGLIYSLVWLTYVKFVYKYQQIVSDYLIERLREELNLIPEKGNTKSKLSFFWSLLYRSIDLKKAKKDINSLKETIQSQGAEIAQSHIQKALLEKELVQNIKFTEKVDMFIHDVKSPLGLIGALQEKSKDEIERSYLSRTKVRLEELLTTLTRVRKEYSENRPDESDTDRVYATIQSLIDEKLLTHPEISIVLNTDSDAAPLLSLQLPENLNRHFSNIINNSIEAEADRITIEICSDTSGLEIRFHDNGCGIEAQSMPLIFDKGFSSGKAQGTGLGLYALHKEMSEVGGELTVESQFGQFTTLSLRFTNR